MKRLFEPKPYNAIITIPNIVTATGLLLLIPYVAGFLFNYRWLMMICLVLAGTSDLLDGFLARKLKQKTRLGEFLDPARDRLLLLGVLIQVVYLSGTSLFFWLGIIVGAEGAIVFLNLITRIEVHLAGKLRQAAHLLLIGLALVDVYFEDIALSVFYVKFGLPLKTVLPPMALFSVAAAGFYLGRTIYIVAKNKK
ncbi:MAG: hypothetical protein A3A10_01315 [Candidatus Tagabacteria bacterium RIFCSPLOWO2_01_FULL_42_9]|uniref:CDP-diacylglycerol--glycerol-3-phosphate 3-phosphatidyltransferase n=1 Tax=Candidatus Tagabacteria bacterium RIFCSPLOWO2_01_FULL_42_9 TaxID=1802296 RepID=A0A1G2LT40_9BACT|nr:MAG: hypothetical protein A3A10_01315 [Candidatus Tagabacteria bacterium RIFCSPLOWO2_01_FULL_42_9]